MLKHHSFIKCAGVLLLSLIVFAGARDIFVNIDPGCLNFGTFGDVEQDIEDAFVYAFAIASAALIRLQNIYVISVDERDRVFRLMETFFVGPSHEEFEQALEAVEDILNRIGNADLGKLKIFCGTPEAPAPADMNTPIPGKFIKYTSDPYSKDSAPFKGGFRYRHWLDPHQGVWLPPGDEICYDPGDPDNNIIFDAFALPSQGFIVLCKEAFTILKATATFPRTFGERKASFAGKAIRGSSVGNGPNTLTYYSLSLQSVFLHELHHLYAPSTDDVQLEKPVPYISSRTSQTAYYTHAYQWLGASALSVQELAKASPDVTKLWKKTDSVTLFALACYLIGNDWCLNTAYVVSGIPDLNVPNDNAQESIVTPIMKRGLTGGPGFDTSNTTDSIITDSGTKRGLGIDMSDSYAGAASNIELDSKTAARQVKRRQRIGARFPRTSGS